MRFALVLPLLLLTLASCKSADELYAEGEQLEQQGRYEEAVRFYADALAKKPSLRKAQGRLLEAGRTVVGNYVADLNRAESEGAWLEAGDLHLDIDRVVAMAARVRVSLPVPEGYTSRRRANFDAAITTLLDEGGLRVNNGGFERGLAAFDQARRYEPRLSQRIALDQAELGAYASWADAELAAGRFRAAYGHAEEALARAAPNTRAAELLIELQREAVLLGGVRTAPAPLARANRRIPDTLVEATNDALVLDQWPQAPPFVRVLEPTIVRRALRDLSLDRRALTDRQAARVGEMLGVEAIVSGEVHEYGRSATVTDRERLRLTTRGGDRIAGYRVEETVRLTAGATFEVVDVASRQGFCQRDVKREVELFVVRGEYGGSARALILDNDLRALFDTAALAEQEEEALLDLSEALAAAVSERVFECVIAQVP